MIRHLFASLCSVLACTAAVAATEVPADKEKFDLYLLVGQSNMAGRGQLSEADRLPADRVLVLNKDDSWAHQGEPVHFDKPEYVGVGLGFTFGKLAAEQDPEVTVGLIPCAVGGTPISRWKPGGDLYEEAVRRAKIAQKDGTLRAILWHQGESETGRRERSDIYVDELTAVIEGFRRDLNAPDVPVIVGELGEFLYTRKNPDNGTLRSPFSTVVNEQIRSVPQHIPNTAVALSHGLDHKGDVLHFGPDALKTFGKRYFEAYLLLQAKRQKEQAQAQAQQ